MLRFKENRFYDTPSPDGGAQGGAAFIPDPKSFLDGAQQQAAQNTDLPPGGGQAPSQPKIDQYWEVFTKRLSSPDKPYEVPEHIKTGKLGDKTLTPDDYFDELAHNIVQNARIEILEQDGLREYKELYEKEKIPFEEFAKSFVETNKQVDYSKMSDVDILKERYTLKHGKSEQNPNGLSEEEINDGINEMSAFDRKREVEKELSAIQIENKQKRDAKMQEIAVKNREKNQKFEEAKMVEIAQIEQELMQNGFKVNNIELGESKAKEIVAAYRELSKLDENGNRPLYTLFDNEKNLFKAFVSLFNEGSAIADHIAQKNNSYAQSILERTSLTPEKPHSLGFGSKKIPDAKSYL